MEIQYDKEKFEIERTSLYEYLGEEEEVIVPEGVTSVSACFHENVERIVLPDSVKYISEGAFSKCKKLKSLVVNKKYVWQAFDTNDWNGEVRIVQKMGPFDKDGDDKVAAIEILRWSKDYSVWGKPIGEEIPYDLFIK
jgi:hypothetical protein